MRFLTLAVMAVLAATPAPALTFFSVGSGDIDGNYYRVAQAICGIINRAHKEELRCSPESTAGSVYNLVALGQGQLDMAIVQSDWQKHAVDGTSVFAKAGPMADLRSVMGLYNESFTLLARRGAAIAGFADLKGRRVDIGHPSSGRQATMRVVMDAFAMTTDDFAAVTELQTGPALAELCAGRIDATVLITGHPSASVQRTLENCDVQIVPLAGPVIDAFVAGRDEYNASTIPADTYGAGTPAVPTFAVTATVVAMAGSDPALVDAVVRATLANLDRLGAALPVMRGLDPAAMRSAGLSAPLHPAAAAAFDAVAAGQ